MTSSGTAYADADEHKGGQVPEITVGRGATRAYRRRDLDGQRAVTVIVGTVGRVSLRIVSS